MMHPILHLRRTQQSMLGISSRAGTLRPVEVILTIMSTCFLVRPWYTSSTFKTRHSKSKIRDVNERKRGYTSTITQSGDVSSINFKTQKSTKLEQHLLCENNNNIRENILHIKDTTRSNLTVCHYSLVIVACCMCYWNSLSGEFVHDDIVAIVKNPDVTRSSVWNIFWNDFWGKSLLDPTSHKSYRPLCVLTFR